MFTTGVHGWLAAAVGCYGLAWLLYACRRQTSGRIVLAVGFLLQSLYLLGRGWLGDVFIPNPMLEGPFLLPWCLAVIALARSLAKPDKRMGGAMGLVAVFSLFSLFYAKGMIPPTPKKLSAWAILFFLSESLAHALFYTGALVALLSLVRRERSNDYFLWLVWGFITYTVAQVTGAIWCFVGWGNTFSWGSRHLASAAIWTFFAASLHLPFISGWKSKSAVMAVAGGLLVCYLSYSGYLAEMRFARIGG
jgi:hypothetical protein